MIVANFYFYVAKNVPDRATLLGAFYLMVMTTVRRPANLPCPHVHHDKKAEATKDYFSWKFPEKFTEGFRKDYLGTSWCVATTQARLPNYKQTTRGHEFRHEAHLESP